MKKTDDAAGHGHLSRRGFLSASIAASMAGVVTVAGCGTKAVSPPAGSLRQRASSIEFDRIERTTGGRIGVVALDLATGERLAHRPAERFAMCSTFKWVLGALVLQRVEAGRDKLERHIDFGPEQLVSYSPVTKKYAGQGMTVGQLCDAMLTISDNTAANLLLETVKGPAGFTAGVRALGDTMTRLDRLEPELNENKKNDPQDTSTPDAMARLMQTVLFGDVLKPESVLQLRQWMLDNRTGRNRLRAGFGNVWQVGNRTGTSVNNQSNDVAFAVSRSQAMRVPGPLIVVSYANVPEPMGAAADAVHAMVAREVTRAFS
ncbi:MAG: class A beta-lactamase [Gammaproteobacteria bacterium]